MHLSFQVILGRTRSAQRGHFILLAVCSKLELHPVSFRNIIFHPCPRDRLPPEQSPFHSVEGAARGRRAPHLFPPGPRRVPGARVAGTL